MYEEIYISGDTDVLCKRGKYLSKLLTNLYIYFYSSLTYTNIKEFSRV